jgi:hypothetical protein
VIVACPYFGDHPVFLAVFVLGVFVFGLLLGDDFGRRP